MSENGLSHRVLPVQMYPTTPSWKPLDTRGNPNLKSKAAKAITSAGCRVTNRVVPRSNRLGLASVRPIERLNVPYQLVGVIRLRPPSAREAGVTRATARYRAPTMTVESSAPARPTAGIIASDPMEPVDSPTR
jgi:hypothetical protein